KFFISVTMAESQVHEHVNNLWSSSSMGDGGSSLFDRYEEDTVANGMGEGAVKEEEMEDIEEEDPFDDVDGSQANRQIAMLNEILAAQSQATIGMSSLITSTSPLDLATLLQATAKEEEGTGEVRPPSSTSSSQCTPTGGASRRGVKREMSEGSASTPDSKRMASNREAANRYRERKKQEMEVMRIEEETLIGRNAELRQMELQVQEEIRQMRDRMTATFGFAPPYEHEPSVFEISSCLSLQDRTPKRIPFPKGLSPAEQNRESVRRDREKKKARFEALKAEEAILAMSKEMLYTQVIKLQGDINHMKQRMRAIGMIVPDITYEY
ncbi:hypothetical protein PRIPAC_84724, partial [Pristionchus pacificus]